VEKVRADLTKAKKVDTVRGQLALVLAEQISKPGATGVQGLVKQLEATLSAVGVIEVVKPKKAKSGQSLVDEVRERRERKARAAAGHS